MSCERNSSYSFVPIFLKLCTCFRHGMRMCMWFGYNCEIIFGHFFHFVNLVIFFTSMYRQWVTCECNCSYNFIPIFLKLCTCFLHGLKMCMWFEYNLCINFCHFFHFANFVIRPSIRQHLPWVSCERNSSNSIVPIVLKLCMCFRHGMRMCMWFRYNCEIIFCHFFHFVNLVIF